jgi:glycosyltransferase involved in cell wall biosynthesis
MIKQPLFSVVVITYNSAKFIIETLESIRSQEYQQLELLISDDCSSDGTVELCQQWLNQHQNRFVRSQILVAKTNQGIPANCNQGVNSAQGDWIKIIAGDDAFYPKTFEHAADFIQENPQARIFSSSSCYYQDTFLPENIIQMRDDSERPLYKMDAKRQYFLLLRSNYIHAGAVFIQRSLIHQVGGFMSQYRFLEDHPLWLKVTKSGERFYYMPQLTLKYRLHGAAVFSHTRQEVLFNNFYKKKRAFEKEMIHPNLRWYERLSFNYIFYVKYSFDLLNINTKTKAYAKLYTFMNSLAPNAIIHLLKGTKAAKS